MAALPEQAFGDDELDVRARDEKLIEAILHAAHAVSHVGEAEAVEDRLLHAGHETKAEVLAHLAHLAQEVQVEYQLLVSAALEVVEQLVHHEEEPLIGVPRVERGHQLLECPLVVGDRVARREPVVDAPRGERFLKLGADKLAEVHGGGAQLGAGNLEAAGDPARRGSHVLVTERFEQVAALGHGRDDGHQVRLAGPVVADHQEALVVRRLIELKLGNQHCGDLLGHLVAHHVGGHEPLRSRLVVGVAQLDDRLDRLELNQVAVDHRALSPFTLRLESDGHQTVTPVAPVLRVVGFGVAEESVAEGAVPRRYDRPVARRALQQGQRVLPERRVEQELRVVEQDQRPVSSDQVIEHTGHRKQPLPSGEIEQPARQFQVEIQYRRAGVRRHRAQRRGLPGAARTDDENQSVVQSLGGFRAGQDCSHRIVVHLRRSVAAVLCVVFNVA